jgi:Tfp pilus assembly protein PilF
MNYSTLKYQAEQSLNQCQYPWAQKLYQHCIELEGSERDNYWYLGLTYLLQGQPETAEEIWLSVLLESSLATENQGLEELENVLTNTANRYQKNGYLKAARDIYEHLLQQFPDRADSYNNLGSVLADQGHWEQAIQLYQQGININPNYPQYYANLGWVLSKQGNYVNAYHYLVHATRLEPSNLLYKKWLAIALSSMYFTESNPTTVELIKDCFQQPDIYKNHLVNPSLSLLRLTSEFQQVCQLCQQGSLTIDNCLDFFANQLGQYLLSSTLIAQLEIENILTILRKTILLSFNPKELYKPPIFDFICALANQCFNNEYIFQLTEQEKKEVNKIQLTIETILVDFNPDVLNLNDLEILLSILCLYEPIYILKNAEKLLKIPEKKWSLTFYPLLEKTLINYYREKEIQRSLLTLTKIEQKTSLLVQSQYEENPYPRWLGMTILPAEPITTVLGNIFPYFEVPSN